MACSNFWKLDKIDKIVISLIFIIGAISSFFYCFGFESEDVPFSIVSGLNMTANKPGNSGKFYSGPYDIGYFKVDPGYKYTISCSGEVSVVSFSNSVPSVGVDYYDVLRISGTSSSYSKSYSFNTNFSKYAVINFSMPSDITVTRVPLTGLDSVIGNLVDSVGPGALWGIFEVAIPFALCVVTLALGFYFLRRSLKWLSRGDGRL